MLILYHNETAQQNCRAVSLWRRDERGCFWPASSNLDATGLGLGALRHRNRQDAVLKRRLQGRRIGHLRQVSAFTFAALPGNFRSTITAFSPFRYGALEDNRLIGFVEGYLEKWNGRYWITNLHILDTQKRGAGIGTALMARIQTAACQSGARSYDFLLVDLISEDLSGNQSTDSPSSCPSGNIHSGSFIASSKFRSRQEVVSNIHAIVIFTHFRAFVHAEFDHPLNI